MEYSISNKGEKILTIKNKNITELTNTEDVEILCCRGCTSLTSIPNIEGLKKLRCDGCTSITSIPNIKGLQYLDCNDCPWIEPDQDRMNKLIKLQKWFYRYLLSIKINKFVSPFKEFWFSPDGPGYRAAIRRLNKRKLEEISTNESCKKKK